MKKVYSVRIDDELEADFEDLMMRSKEIGIESSTPTFSSFVNFALREVLAGERLRLMAAGEDLDMLRQSLESKGYKVKIQR